MSGEESVACAGCGAMVPRSDGPTHAYIGASPGCWAIFGEVGARGAWDDQLRVDAYAAQHPGTPSRQSIQSVCVHLISLCAQLERGATSPRAREVIGEALGVAYRFVWLDPPRFDGALTIVDVAAGADVRAWAESVWRAWSPHHDTVRAWLNALS